MTYSILHLRRFLAGAMCAVFVCTLFPLNVFAEDVPNIANESGLIPVLEYHNFAVKEANWIRSYDNFQKDLEFLYNNGYRAISVRDFATKHFDVPAGKKPVILTFDDGSKSQFPMDGDKPAALSGVGILDAFVQKHPDFGSSAMFFLNADAFRDKATVVAKVKYLFFTGREIGNHTYKHTNLSKVSSASEVMAAFGQEVKYLSGLGLEQEAGSMMSTAFSFGGLPKNPVAFEAVKKGTFENFSYENTIGFLVGAGPAKTSYDPTFDPYRVPRIQASDAEFQRLFGRAPGSVDPVKEKFQPFVSDGNADVFATASTSISLVPVGEPAQIVFPYQSCHDEDAQKYIDSKPRIQRMFFQQLGYQVHGGNFFTQIPHNIAMMWKRLEGSAAPRGIYLSGGTAGRESGEKMAEQSRKSGATAVVFDVKEVNGFVYYPSNIPLVKEIGSNVVTIPDLKELVGRMHDKGLYVIARLVSFKDDILPKKKPELAVRSLSHGGAWSARDGVVWLDPSNDVVHQYLIDIAEEVTRAGVDEIQFDYIRFPTEGNLADTSYGYDVKNMDRWMVIRDFLKKARDRLDPFGVKVSLDVFGAAVWNKGYDGRGLGQVSECLSPYVHVINPMVYPSHWGPGYGGHANPADEPYYFVHESVRLFQEAVAGTNTAIRPYLQAFEYRASNYGTQYVLDQVRAAADLGVHQFLLWNAGNNYQVTWPAFGG